MKSRNYWQILLMTLVAIGAFLVLKSADPNTGESSCKRSLEPCPREKKAGKADKMIWENLSQQFFSAI